MDWLLGRKGGVANFQYIAIFPMDCQVLLQWPVTNNVVVVIKKDQFTADEICSRKSSRAAELNCHISRNQIFICFDSGHNFKWEFWFFWLNLRG